MKGGIKERQKLWVGLADIFETMVLALPITWLSQLHQPIRSLYCLHQFCLCFLGIQISLSDTIFEPQLYYASSGSWLRSLRCGWGEGHSDVGTNVAMSGGVKPYTALGKIGMAGTGEKVTTTRTWVWMQGQGHRRFLEGSIFILWTMEIS